MANLFGFNSEHWWPHITKLADSFVNFINQHKNDNAAALKMNDLEQVKEVYYRNLVAFKRRFYGKKEVEKPPYLDVHKVAALYIKAFLEVSPFYSLNRKQVSQTDLTEAQLYPNEYFAMELMKLILISWNESKTAICMKKNEKDWFIGLLNHFRLDVEELDVLSLASTIYYIEDKYITQKQQSN